MDILETTLDIYLIWMSSTGFFSQCTPEFLLQRLKSFIMWSDTDWSVI